MPLISVIVPFYNESLHLRRSILSIRNQTFQDFEVLLIDDLSTDDSFALAKELTVGDCRFRLLRNEHKGLFHARNLALSEARGEYICFLDADDELLPDYLSALYTDSLQGESDLVIQGFTHVVGECHDLFTVRTPGLYLLSSQAEPFFSSFNVVDMGNVFGKLYRRSIILDHHLEFSPHVLLSEDMYFVVSYLVHCQQVFLSSKANYLYIAHKASMSTFYWDFPTEERSFLALNAAWHRLLHRYTCPSLMRAFGTFTGNYVNRLIFTNIVHPKKSNKKENFKRIESEYLFTYQRHYHAPTLFTKCLKWAAVNHLYRIYHWLMRAAIFRYGITVNFG